MQIYENTWINCQFGSYNYGFAYLFMLEILEILDVGSEFAKVCPSVCSANCCYRASRVLYPKVALVLRWQHYRGGVQSLGCRAGCFVCVGKMEG